MTPIDFARRLSDSPDIESRALGVAIIARGLSDDDPRSLRQGWPLNESVRAAMRYLALSGDDLAARALAIAPTVSDAMLNRSPR